MNFGIIGTGIVGTALAIKLTQAGYACVGVHTRTGRSYEQFRRYLDVNHLDLAELLTRAQLLFITTQDGVIRSVAERMAELNIEQPGQIWIHCSGSLSSNILKVRPDQTARCLSVHPLQAFADVPRALALIKGTHFGVEGEAVSAGEQIVHDLGGVPHELQTADKALYHAGAVMASNYMVVLASLAVKLFTFAGISQDEALESLLPLMKGTLHNLEEVGLSKALTGPILRGDTDVIKGHLAQMPLDVAGIYRGLGREAMELGRAKLAYSGTEYRPEVWSELSSLLE